MLNVNADDFGRCVVATDRTMACLAANRINSASAMVFMEDSERAAGLAIGSGLDVGLHINFTEAFTASYVPRSLRRSHDRLRRFLRSNKYALVIYNPFLRSAFRDVFVAQFEEFTRLYGRVPSRVDGHQHMHLCSNMVVDGLFPTGTRVRRNLSFTADEKSFLNRYYRRLVDRSLAKRYRVGDFLFALSQQRSIPQLGRVIALAKSFDVELVVHPQVNVEFETLLSDEFATTISTAQDEISIPRDARAAHSLCSSDLGLVRSQVGAHMLPHITVCICTFRRPTYLKRLLEKLQEQSTGGRFSFSAVVCDNDARQSAAPIVSAARQTATIDVTYCCEPRQNIALARNKALEQARGDFVTFIDDDEFPVADWLQSLLSACETYTADGVLGPVRPHFESAPPSWILKGRFCERPEHTTGMKMQWNQCRTGNLLFRKEILEGTAQPFRAEFGTGGEDKDFFMRLTEQGRVFVWCNEAIAYETVLPSRYSRRCMIRRALLRGRISLKFPVGRLRLLGRSALAIPVYCMALPVLLLLGQHWFMRYCVKLCDHLGRLLAVLGINPISEREA
ncbi:MAG TPA: ChbG/HpnK family deacetylase [Candidatus Udaeobacter sp.]